MTYISKTIEQCSLWKSTLAQVDNDMHKAERERLRSSFIGFRARVSLLAVEIAKDLPDLTVHDISHLDALWEVASQIVGSDFKLTPTEGYVLGGSILLHDLAMSIAATPGGLNAIKADTRWGDAIHGYFREHYSRQPTKEDLNSPPEEVRRAVVFDLLRQLHAENAEKLAFVQFGSTSSHEYLIEDTELRQTFGRVIGQVAHSHWWSLAEVERRFERPIGAPHWAPPTWTIDPLKIACILRAADAAHIDARRAPSFQKHFLNISEASRPHWIFQERLNKSYVRDDALVFTSGQAFSLDEANAWWLCLDTLRMIDSELKGVDSMLADRSLPRFVAKRIAGVDHPERLAQYVQTSDWHPIHAAVHLSDLPRIIRSLGGEELYGRNPSIPLRELIQNSSDAVRARRKYEDRPNDYGHISVEIKNKEGSFHLLIEDNGIGMSRRVLTQYLLDFGCSFWSKPQVQEEFPGLLSSGFQSTGKYGIGFFSVFMASDKVKIITRRPDAAASETLVLEFGSGLEGRPILRPARREEQLRDGGTIVDLMLRVPPDEAGGLLYRDEGYNKPTLLSRCYEIAPTLDVKLIVIEDDQALTAIEARDWLTIPGEVLLGQRCPKNYEERFPDDEMHDFISKASSNLKILNNQDGSPIARICITAADRSYSLPEPTNRGAITVGGFAASPLQGIAGFIIGESTRAARDSAAPSIPAAQLAEWASAQASLIPELYQKPESQASAALTIRLCGGETGNLPIALHNGEWISAPKIEELRLPNEIVIIDWFTHDYELKHTQNLMLDRHVFVTNASGIPVIFQERRNETIYESSLRNKFGLPTSLSGAVIEAVARSWGIPPADLARENTFDRESEVRVGEADGREIRTNGHIICRPNP